MTNQWIFLTDFDDLVYANILILIAIACFYFGYKQGIRKSQKMLKRYLIKNIYFSKSSFFLENKRFAAAIIFIATFFAFVVSKSGFSSLLLRSQSGVTQAVGGWGPFGLVAEYFFRPLPLILLLFYLYEVQINRCPKKLQNFVFLVGSLILLLLLNFPTSTARFYTFTVYLAIIFVLNKAKKKSSFFYLFVLVFGLFGASLIDIFRHVDALTNVRLNLSFGLSNFFVGHYDAYENFIHGIQYVELHGNTWGQQLGGALLFWVPRSIWLDKPISTGAYVAEKYLGSHYAVYNNNLSSPFIEELYIDFHIPAIVVGCFLLGLLFGYLDYSYKQAVEFSSIHAQFEIKPQPLYLVLYPTLIGLSLLLLRGSAMSALAYSSGMVAAYVVLRCFLVKTG
ncbi:MAG: hypothetical protein ACTS3T_02065 [Almyronema sp.]